MIALFFLLPASLFLGDCALGSDLSKASFRISETTPLAEAKNWPVPTAFPTGLQTVLSHYLQSILSSLTIAFPTSYPFGSASSRVVPSGPIPSTTTSSGATRPSPSSGRTEAIVEAFQFAWAGYRKYAFPADQLLPVTDGSANPYNGWGATVVDGLDTAIVMRQTDIVNEMLEHVAHINYGQTGQVCSLFETTIRYLGGMLASYDLLTGPFADLGVNSSANVRTLLTQSVNLANKLKFAFDTPIGVPINNLNITAQKAAASDVTNSLATTGSLVLEWTRLSDLTNDASYGRLAQKGELPLLNPKPLPLAEPFPGLLGDNINVDNGQFVDGTGGWIGGSDSFYEYLVKMYIYDNSRFGNYMKRWQLAVDSSIRYLLSHSSSQPQYSWLAQYSGRSLSKESQHLTCFDGGNFLLGGMALKNQTILKAGLTLVDGCHQLYQATASKIGPDSFGWDPNNIPSGQETFYKQNGFYVGSAVYTQRPEVLESYYYAYRATRDPKYQDWSWEAFVAINKTGRTHSGFSTITDVTQADGGSKSNSQESFFLAEVLKYAYLIQAPDAIYQAFTGGVNHFVFNTEGHLLKVKGAAI